MPPRYAYWTILIDNAPTAFRAKEQADLLPTLQQLRRTNQNVTLKWFAHGRIWDAPELAVRPRPPREDDGVKRGRDWRPGGQHKDPRARFDKAKKKSDKPFGKARTPGDRPDWTPSHPPASTRPPAPKRPWQDRPRPPHAAGGGDRDRRGPHGGFDRRPPSAPRDQGGSDRPWQGRPRPPADGRERQPTDRHAPGSARFDRPRADRPRGDRPRGDRPWGNKPGFDQPRGKRPPSDRPPGDRRPTGGPPASRPPDHRPPFNSRPPSGRPHSTDRRPPAPRGDREREGWRGKPKDPRAGWQGKPKPFSGPPRRRPDDSGEQRRRKPKDPKTPGGSDSD